jgi:hypothetical protein
MDYVESSEESVQDIKTCYEFIDAVSEKETDWIYGTIIFEVDGDCAEVFRML